MTDIWSRLLGRRNRARHIEPNLKAFARKVHSQFDEDGIIEKLAACLGIERGTFFEFGIGPAWNTPPEAGLEGNFVLLREKGWSGVFLDGNEHPPQLGVSREFITPLNINHLYAKYHLPDDLDFMSIDIDGQELWVWLALIARPKVVIVEYNGSVPADQSVSIPFDVDHVWDGTRYHGASLKALDKVAKAKFYTLVFANGVNAFFVRDDLVANKGDFRYDDLYAAYPGHPQDPQNRPWVQI